ncbi:uncharacterized protein LOC126844921 [Adelges cooleyi]|uniref:uncharacterized protein LOC126844921 n=1 Tax=Adelges cooleyi TaxID=133065 RepID=UPI00218006B0|nr:uncharacterized protein LOC126844921 [Adelges cooleyi]
MMTSRLKPTYSEKLEKINSMRWPNRRHDYRLREALYFWLTVPDNLDVSVPEPNSTDFEVIRTLSDEEKYPSRMSRSQRRKLNIRKRKGCNLYMEAKQELWREAARVDLFRQRVSNVYGLEPEDVLPVVFRDELGNTFFAALNENTTDADVLRARIYRFRKLVRRLRLSQGAALRAVCSTEIFVILINQVWEAVGLKTEQYLLKMVEVTAMCMSFIEMAGLLHDPVFITMSGHLDKKQLHMFEALDAVSQEYSYANKYLRYDLYFNENHKPENWSAISLTEHSQRTLALYFNDSCIYSPHNPDDAWRITIPYLGFTLVDCIKHSVVHNRLLLDAYTLFTLSVCEEEMFKHSVVPNELGNVYIIFDGSTPAHRISYILTTAASLADEFLHDPRCRGLNRLMHLVMNFKVPGYFCANTTPWLSCT